MTRTAYTLSLNSRIEEIRKLAGNEAEPNKIGFIGWSQESGGYSFYRVVNHSGGITVLRRTSTKAELLDYLEGLLAGYRAALMANEKLSRDSLYS